MKKAALLLFAILCVASSTACNKPENKSDVSVPKTSVVSQGQQSQGKTQEQTKEESDKSEVERHHPGMFEREEQSLAPVSKDNVVDIGGDATQEQTSSIEKPGVDETPYPITGKTRAEEFLDTMRTSKSYVFTCGDIKIVRNGDNYYLDKEGFLKLDGKSYLNGKLTEGNFDEQLADAYANLYPLNKSCLVKSVVDYETYEINGEKYRVIFRENGISIIYLDKDVQVDFDMRTPDEDDMYVFRLRS